MSDTQSIHGSDAGSTAPVATTTATTVGHPIIWAGERSLMGYSIERLKEVATALNTLLAKTYPKLTEESVQGELGGDDVDVDATTTAEALEDYNKRAKLAQKYIAAFSNRINILATNIIEKQSQIPVPDTEVATQTDTETNTDSDGEAEIKAGTKAEAHANQLMKIERETINSQGPILRSLIATSRGWLHPQNQNYPTEYNWSVVNSCHKAFQGKYVPPAGSHVHLGNEWSTDPEGYTGKRKGKASSDEGALGMKSLKDILNSVPEDALKCGTGEDSGEDDSEEEEEGGGDADTEMVEADE